VKRLARKKRQEASSGGGEWITTFADLMNLLLCFFVLLFAMSEIDAEKFQNISISMSNSFGVFEGGGRALNEGPLISSGMSQLNNLDQYTNTMGKQGPESDQGKDPTSQNTKFEGELSEAYELLQEKMEELSGEMFTTVESLTNQYELDDYVELNIDPEFRYVQLSMKGSILFEPGKADIIAEAKPILSRLGDILAKFDGYTIEIIGHTDNVPMRGPAFKDNNWLSSARALNAAEYLIENNKLDPKNVKYSGRGEYEPIADNSTSEGRAKNRRIEIRILNEYSGR
jgi:chemotaxis protein MotB